MTGILKVDQWKDSGDNTLMTSDGAGVLTANAGIIIPSGATITNNGTASGFGKIGQVVTSTLSSQVSLTISGATDIGLSASITPTSTSSKILILYKLNYSNASGDGFVGRLVRNSTNIFLGDSGTGQQGTLSFQTANMNNYWSLEAGGSFLDTPSTTSSTTYKFQAVPTAGTLTMYFNRTARGGSGDPLVPSSITLMEVLA